MKTRTFFHTFSLGLLILSILLCVTASLRLNAAERTDIPESFYAKGTWTVSPFASYRVHEFGEFNGEIGGGLALSYFPKDNIAIEVETLSEDIDDSNWADAFTEAGVNLKGYLPLGATGLAPYFLIGYTRGFDLDENRMNAGAGIEWRATKTFGLFADGRWTHDFDTLGHALIRVGGNVSF
jgi:hypothetical protein